MQVRCGATKYGEESLQARATLKGRSILSSASILLFINLTKPLTRQDCSHTRCNTLYEDLVRRSPPELLQQRKSSSHDAAKKAKDIDGKKKLVIRFLATQETQTVYSPGLYIQVHIRVWLPVVECAAAWPIKKKNIFFNFFSN